jgi:hypothetical protein
MSNVEKIMDQSERVLEEVSELADFVNDLRGYTDNLNKMVESMRPYHWDGGDDLDTGGMKSEIADIETTANDYIYDVRQLESHTGRLLGAIEDLEELKKAADEEA